LKFPNPNFILFQLYFHAELIARFRCSSKTSLINIGKIEDGGRFRGQQVPDDESGNLAHGFDLQGTGEKEVLFLAKKIVGSNILNSNGLPAFFHLNNTVYQ
jgi:hypothetical protein